MFARKAVAVGGIHPCYDRPGGRGRRREDEHDRFNLAESPSYGLQPAGKKRPWPTDRAHQWRYEYKISSRVDAQGRQILMFVTAGPVSDYTRAVAMLRSAPQAEWMLADRGYYADWFRDALKDKEIKACIPDRKDRKKAVRHDKRRYKRSCLAGSRIGNGLRPDTTGNRSSSFRPSRSPQSSCSGSKINESGA